MTTHEAHDYLAVLAAAIISLRDVEEMTIGLVEKYGDGMLHGYVRNSGMSALQARRGLEQLAAYVSKDHAPGA